MQKVVVATDSEEYQNDGSDSNEYERHFMNAITANVRWVLIPVFCVLTGYTDKAVRRKIEDGIWVEGIHYRRAPDGHITMNIQEYYKWVEQGA